MKGLFYTLLHRIASSTCLAFVSLLDTLTLDSITQMQGLYVGCLVFLVVEALGSVTTKLRLFKRVCMLYCNQRLRGLFSPESTETAALGNLFLAVTVAIVMMATASKHSEDIQSLLMSLMYLYGDILDFALVSYGVFKVTVAALMVSVWAEATERPKNRIYAFCFELVKIISTNLVCEGVNALIQSSAVELEILECMATVALMRMFIPSMESYLTYLAARRLVLLIPNFSSFFGCCLVWVINTSFVPGTGKTWLGELAFNYIVLDTSVYLQAVTLPWVVFAVILLHYTDYIVTLRMSSK